MRVWGRHLTAGLRTKQDLGSERLLQHLLGYPWSRCRELAAQPADTEVADFERRLREREAQLHQREAQAPPRRVSLFDLPRQSDLEPRP